MIISARNCLQWLPRCLDSIAAQSYRHFDLVILDDQSTEVGQWEWTEWTCRKQGWLALKGEKRLGPLGGLVAATQAANCAEEDVIIHIDGDDWLAHNEVFALLNAIYSQGKVDLTYGQFINYPWGKLGYTRKYSRRTVRNRTYRKDLYARWGHLRTFKSFLWNAINDSDLRTPSGEYIRFAADNAFMYPMMEMVGRRFEVIDKILYIYNEANPSAETWHRGIATLGAMVYISKLPSYSILDRCLDDH